MAKLDKLVEQLSQQHTEKHDYVLPANQLYLLEGQLKSRHLRKTYTPNGVMHEGLSDKLGIPMQYYRRLQAKLPHLLDTTVTQWLGDLGGKHVMLRTFEGAENVARAFLSDKYQAIDNYDVLFAALEALKAAGMQVEIQQATVTDARMYLNVVCPEVEIQATEILKGYLASEDAVGNGIISGLTISNSEVGCGSFLIRPRAVILKCQNGLIATDDTFSRIHLGGKLETGLVQWSQETKNRNFELIMSQIRDAIKHFLSREYLGKMVVKLQQAAATKLEHPIDAVQHVCKELRYTDDQRKQILEQFAIGGDMRASGIAHAITRHAQEENPDVRHEMEVGAFRLLPRLGDFDKPFSGN